MLRPLIVLQLCGAPVDGETLVPGILYEGVDPGVAEHVYQAAQVVALHLVGQDLGRNSGGVAVVENASLPSRGGCWQVLLVVHVVPDLLRDVPVSLPGRCAAAT